MITYLAAPFSHPSPAIRYARIEAATHAATHLTKMGAFVYSPLSYVAVLGGEVTLPNEKWLNHCTIFLAACQRLMIMCLPGFDTSFGCNLEFSLAKVLKLDIVFWKEADLKQIIPPDVWKKLYCSGV